MLKDLAHSLRGRLIGEVAGEDQAGSSAGLESGMVNQNKSGQYLCGVIPEKADSAQRMEILGGSLVSSQTGVN